jgi:hypothetical protein
LVVQCVSEDFEDAPQHADADPLLKPPVAGLMRRIAIRQVGPRCSSPQDPQDAIEHRTVPLRGRPRPSARRTGSGKKRPTLSTRSIDSIGRVGVASPSERETASVPRVNTCGSAVTTDTYKELSKGDLSVPHSVALDPLARGYSNLRNDLTNPLRLLAALVGLVLLVACINVANLLLCAPRPAMARSRYACRLARRGGGWCASV